MKVRTEARREAIITEATELFCELGFERTSMNEIAKRVGGSKTTLYGYFESKEVLFEAVIKSISKTHLDSAFDALLTPNLDGIENTLLNFGEAVIVLINDPKALAVYRMVIAESGRSTVGSMFYKNGPQRVINALSQFITHAIENKVFKDHDPHVAARHFLFLVKSESEHFLFDSNPPALAKTEMKQMVRRATDVFIDAYSLR